MIELNEGVEATEKIAKTAERYPWGTTVAVLLIVIAVLGFFWNYDRIRANQCETEKSNLFMELLLTNKVIDRRDARIQDVQDSTFAVADSIVRQETRAKAAELLQKHK